MEKKGKLAGVRIAWDYEGVINDYEGYLKRVGGEWFAKKGREIIDPDGYDLQEIFDCSTLDTYKFWLTHYFPYAKNEPAKPDVAPVINLLIKEEAIVSLMTGRKFTELKHNLLGWLARREVRVRLAKDGIHFNGGEPIPGEPIWCKDSRTAIEKVEACKRNNFHYVVDDRASNFPNLSKVTTVLAIATSNNRKFPYSDYQNVHRFGTVTEAGDFILEDWPNKKALLLEKGLLLPESTDTEVLLSDRVRIKELGNISAAKYGVSNATAK